MCDPGSWPELAAFLDSAERKSRPERVAARLAALRHRVDTLQVPGVRPTRVPARDTSQVIEGFAGVTCSDTDNPDRAADWADADAADRRDPYFGRAWIWGSSICASWPGVDEDRFTGPYSPDTANPVLVVGTRFDPATRYQDAVSAAGILGRARLLTLDGWGHTSLFESACIDDYTADYLLHRTLPPRGPAAGRSGCRSAADTPASRRARPLGVTNRRVTRGVAPQIRHAQRGGSRSGSWNLGLADRCGVS